MKQIKNKLHAAGLSLFNVCLGTLLAIFLVLRSTPSQFVWGRGLRFFVLEKDSLQVVLKNIHSEFVWGRCLRFLAFEICLGTVLAILLLLQKIHFKFVWGRCLRFFVFEECSFASCLGPVLAILGS